MKGQIMKTIVKNEYVEILTYEVEGQTHWKIKHVSTGKEKIFVGNAELIAAMLDTKTI